MEDSYSSLPFHLGTIAGYGLIWAACHDISREAHVGFELGALSLILPAFALLCLAAWRRLRGHARAIWTGLNLAFLAFFILSASAAVLRPKFVHDFVAGAVALPLCLLTATVFLWQGVRRPA